MRMPRRRPRAEPPKSANTLEGFLTRIREARNFDFRNYKRATLQRRLQRRMADVGARPLSDYARYLEREPKEFDQLIAAMLIKVTAFFRDDEVRREPAKRILPP